MILIVGARGKLGRAVTNLLLHRGVPVRAMTRYPERLSDSAERGAEVVHGDLRIPATLAASCEGVKRVLAAAHAFDGKGGNDSRVVDDSGNRSLIDAARIAGVERFVFTSTLGASPHHPVDFFRTKYRIEQYLSGGDLEWVIVRPTVFMEQWADIIRKQIATRGVAPIFGRGDNSINFVSVADVARYCVLALEREDLRNRILEVGGPENLTLEEVAGIFERVLGRQAKRKHMPVPVMQTLGTILGPFNPAAARMMKAGVNMATADLAFDMRDTLREFPQPLTRLEEVARSAPLA